MEHKKRVFLFSKNIKYRKCPALVPIRRLAWKRIKKAFAYFVKHRKLEIYLKELIFDENFSHAVKHDCRE